MPTTPTYNLGAIMRETDLNADTLRAWERRYNLPQPTRSKGGQRLYCQRDLDMLKWLIEKQETGLRISQAAELWHKQVKSGLDPLAGGSQTEESAISGKNLSVYREQWVSACLAFNESKAEQTLAEAFSLYPPETVCFDVLFAGLSAMGDSWYQGEITVQQEHFASSLAARRLHALISGAPPPIRPERIVIAAPTEEVHILPSLLITYLLRRRGWHVVYLGADVPLDNFRSTIEGLQPDLVILIAHQLFTAASLLDLSNALAELPVALAFGGLIYNRIPGLQKVTPGHYLGDDLKNAAPNIEQLLHNPNGKFSAMPSAASPYLQEFQIAMPLIESRISNKIQHKPEMKGANSRYLSRDILAALRLGELSFLSSDLTWIRGLLSNLKTPDHLLQEYLQIYSQAVEETLGSQGAPVLNWLEGGINTLAKNNSPELEKTS